MLTIDRLFRQHHLAPSDLADIHLSIGPGGFTGLRTAVATAKMLAFSLNARIIAVPTALVVAESVPAPVPPAPTTTTTSINHPLLAVALASKRDALWWTTFTFDNSKSSWQPTIPGELLTLDQLRDPSRNPATPAPSLLAADAATLSLLQPLLAASSWRDTKPITAIFDPAACWRAGRRLALQNQFADPVTLTPLYAREPEAVRLVRLKSLPTTFTKPPSPP